MEFAFEKYVNLIRKQAHLYSDMFGIDYDEMESQGFLIYCKCLETYDCTKSGFSTHLFYQLKKLKDFALTYNRQKGILIYDCFIDKSEAENYEKNITKDYNLTSVDDLLIEAKENLSRDAFNLLSWIISFEWKKKEYKKMVPTKKLASQVFNFSPVKIHRLWSECENFWNTKGIALYC